MKHDLDLLYPESRRPGCERGRTNLTDEKIPILHPGSESDDRFLLIHSYRDIQQPGILDEKYLESPLYQSHLLLLWRGRSGDDG